MEVKRTLQAYLSFKRGEYYRSGNAHENYIHVEKRTVELFRSYDWPGNVCELQNVVERSVIVSPDDVFCVDEAWLSTDATKTRGNA